MCLLPQSTTTSSGKAKNPYTRGCRPEPTPLGVFAQLPQEVREMIYAPVFADGSVALTRASKAFRESTKRCLYQHGVYRVHVDPTTILGGNNLIPNDYIPKAQNLHIRVASLHPHAMYGCLLAYDRVHYNKVIGWLARVLKKHKHCHLQLTREALCIFKYQFIKGMRALKIFESITVEIIEEYERKWLRYLNEPRKKNDNELAKIKLLLRLEEGEKGPRLNIIRHPPHGYDWQDDDVRRTRRVFQASQGQP